MTLPVGMKRMEAVKRQPWEGLPVVRRNASSETGFTRLNGTLRVDRSPTTVIMDVGALTPLADAASVVALDQITRIPFRFFAASRRAGVRR